MQQIQFRNRPSGNATAVAIVIIVAVVAIGLFALTRFQGKRNGSRIKNPETTAPLTPSDIFPSQERNKPLTAPSDQQNNSNQGDAPAIQTDVKAFVVTGQNFSFSLSEIRVKKGDKVKINIINEGGFHDWVLDEFNARTPRISDGETAEVEFTADRAGTFEYYCSVGEHRAMGMKGNLIVE